MNIQLRIFLCVAVTLCMHQLIIAQGEANIWYFGSNAGLDFNTNPPTALTNGMLSTSEGCAAVSDKNGVLVFYTDGITVWNKNHLAMPNGTGLLGNPSATQSAIIAPFPGTYNYSAKRFNKYFIVTVDDNGGSNGVCYSEVDMTLNGGFGDVTATKNIYLFGTTTSEKICVAQHANDCDFWVIGKPVGTVDYYSYAITSSGFNTTPVISSVGPSVVNHLGSLKASPDSKLVTATYGVSPSGLYVYDFDNTSGLLSMKFSDNSLSGYPYSQEFSPDNKILYYTLLNNSNIYQYDLTASTNAAFLSSRQIIGTTANSIGYKMCAIQIAPNGKIYAALQGQTSLGVINNPNVLGTSCGYVDMQQSLAGKSSQLGLPAIVTSLIRPINKITMSDSCAEQIIQFGLLDTNKISNFDWRFSKLSTPNTLLGSSTISNPIMQFDTAGLYLVTAINNYACYTDTILDTINILPLPNVIFTTTNVSCFGLNNGAITVNAFGGAAPYSYNWSNSATTASITGLGTANYLVTTTDSKGCAILDSIAVTSPLALTIDTVIVNHVNCFGDATGDATVIASGGTIPYSYSWNTTPAQTSQQAVNLTQGSYTCTITDSNLCTTTQTITANEPPLLVANITNNLSICQGNSGNLNSLNTGGTGSYSYNWQPGGLTTQTINVSPDSTTKYVLTLTDQNICIAKDSGDVIINPNPVVNFGVPPVCVGQTSVFTDSTVISNGSITTYNWTFGIGSAGSTLQNPTYIYPSCATYTIGLTAISDSGCTSFNTKPVIVYCLPVASFTVNNICTYQQAVFNNTSIGADIYAWDFDYNTGIDDTASSPYHVYSPGNYTAQLVAISINGCIDSITHTLEVYPAPVADYTADTVCLNFPTNFTDLSSVAAPDYIGNWYWDFDYNTGIDSTTSSPTYLYTLAGTYSTFLKVISNQGCVDSISKNVIIHSLPNASFAAPNVCDGNSVPFDYMATMADNDTIQSIKWDFGDGTITYNIQDISHLYNNQGNYTVQLLVISNFGCADSISTNVVVNPNPNVIFTTNDTSGCEPFCVSFQTLSFVNNGSIANWSWDFGDGSSAASTQDVVHCYATATLPSSFSPALTVISDSGCVDTLVKTNYITVFPQPDAQFTATPQNITFTNPIIYITNSSTGADYWYWNFGDLQTDSIDNPTPHSYADTGTFLITLIVSSQFNCIDTAYQTVIIEPDFLFYIPNAFTPNDDGVNDAFISTGMFFKEFEMTIFDRWGNLIYKTNDINKPWDGKANHGDGIAQGDVYVYVVKITDFRSGKHNYKGIVTLVR